MSDVQPANPSRQHHQAKGHRGQAKQAPRSAGDWQRLAQIVCHRCHRTPLTSQRLPVTHQSTSWYVVSGFEYSMNAGARVVRNQSVHLISESNATPRTAIPQRYPPRPPKALNRSVNRLRIASITPMKGANKSPIPPRPPNKSPRIITILLSLLFGLLVPCRFFFPHCGRHA